MSLMRPTLIAALCGALILSAAGPALGQTPLAPPAAPAGAHTALDDLNVLLLYGVQSGQRLDPLLLVEATAGRASADIALAWTHYREARDARERFERKTLIEFALQERQDALRSQLPYLVPLASVIGPYDPQRGAFPLRLSLDDGGRSGNPDQQCLPVYRFDGVDLRACLVTASLHNTADPIFTALPIAAGASAAGLAARHAQGKLRFYGLARPLGTGGFVTAPGAQAQRNWQQALTLTGLVLVDSDSGQVLAVARASAAGMPAGLAQGPQAQPGVAGTVPAWPPAAPGTAPATGSPWPPGPATPRSPAPPGPDQVPGADPRSAGPVPASPAEAASVRELDRLLSLLSLAVYSDADKIRLAAADIGALEAKMARINNDAGRNEGVRNKELTKLALALEKKQRGLAEHVAMLDLKAKFPASLGLTPVPAASTRKNHAIHYEQYRLRDGRHIVVFRGSDTGADFETDFQLATTPEMLQELGQKYEGGGSGPGAALGGWMREYAQRQVATNPAAFTLADALVASIVRSGVKPSRIVLTGHSLGGALAQYAGLRNGVHAIVSFNPAPLSPGLIQQLPATRSAEPVSGRNYIAFVPRADGTGGTFDPVSSAMAELTGLRNPASLQVLGEKRVVTVCNDLDSEAYQAFSNSAQGIVSSLTLSTMAVGKGSLVKAGTAIGAASGVAGAGTERASAVWTGGSSGRTTGKAIGAGMNCLRHPFLCSAAAAGGGIISIATRIKLPQYWSLYTAHSMKTLNAAMLEDGPPACARQSDPG